MGTIERLEEALDAVGGHPEFRTVNDGEIWAGKIHNCGEDDCLSGLVRVFTPAADFMDSNAALIVAAVNALPALLKVAKAARAHLLAMSRAEAGEIEEQDASRAELELERALAVLDDVK